MASIILLSVLLVALAASNVHCMTLPTARDSNNNGSKQQQKINEECRHWSDEVYCDQPHLVSLCKKIQECRIFNQKPVCEKGPKYYCQLKNPRTRCSGYDPIDCEVFRLATDEVAVKPLAWASHPSFTVPIIGR